MKMHIPGLPQQYERTCEDCGTSWRVSRAIAHPHMQGLPMERSAAFGDVSATTDAVVEANAALAEKAAASRRCPKCESDHYKQRSIRT